MKKFSKEDIKKLTSLVPIHEVCYNDWNPKQKRSEEYYKVRDSIEKNGQLIPVIVRNSKNPEYKYEIIDGEQRYTALADLDEDKVLITNLGDISDEDAKAKTVWLEQAVPFDDELLGNLLVDLVEKVDLPYTVEEIDLLTLDFKDDEEEPETEPEPTEKPARLRLKLLPNCLEECKELHSNLLEKFKDYSEEEVNTAFVRLLKYLPDEEKKIKQELEIEQKLQEENNKDSN